MQSVSKIFMFKVENTQWLDYATWYVRRGKKKKRVSAFIVLKFKF